MSLRKINNNGTKIIFISHNLDQVKRLADEVIFLHKGKVCEQSKKNDFFIKPKSKYAVISSRKYIDLIIMMKIYLITLLIYVFLPKILFGDTTIIIQSTTSTKNSGFYNFILPIIAKETGVNANVVAVGTGAAIKNSMNCDGDILLVRIVKKKKKNL